MSIMAQLWDGWELHILVLASLSAQYSLPLFAGVSRFHIPPWLRLSIRLAHVGSDALAISALATLVSRQKNGPRSNHARASRDLELLWSPILVMHLGGQVVITTYKIEDNEQWRRNILTSLSKVTVALYMFYNTWSSNDRRLLAATIFLFILVTIRCFHKAIDLKRTTFKDMRERNSSQDSISQGPNIKEDEQLSHFVQTALKVQNCDRPLQTIDPPSPRLMFQLILDLPRSYEDRSTLLRNFWFCDQVSAYSAIEDMLSDMTSLLYTKDGTRISYLHFQYGLATFISSLLKQVLDYATLIAAICLVHTSRYKEIYSRVDILVTLVLLYGTLLLELVYLGVQSAFRDRFSGRIPQYDLIGLFSHNKRYSKFRSIAGWLNCKDLLDSFWHMEPSYSCKEITQLVRSHVVEKGWMDYIRDMYSYKMFNDSRGEWTLARNRCLRQLGWSIRRPFDESIVLWHLATDLLYIHHTSTSTDDHGISAQRCKEMSNYMLHLLSDNPEMLMPGSRKWLIATACEEFEVLLKGEKTPWDEKELTRRVFEKWDLARSISEDTNPSLIGDASVLVQILLDFEDQTKIWELIQGVWVEMLCFSAGRCRGYLYADTLGTGVEFLSYVWILLAHTGMETFPEKIQRREGQPFDLDESLGFGLARGGERRR